MLSTIESFENLQSLEILEPQKKIYKKIILTGFFQIFSELG